jgi:hypothetical protein
MTLRQASTIFHHSALIYLIAIVIFFALADVTAMRKRYLDTHLEYFIVTKDPREAILIADIMIRLNPENPEFYRQMAENYLKLDDKRMAEIYFNRAEQLR